MKANVNMKESTYPIVDWPCSPTVSLVNWPSASSDDSTVEWPCDKVIPIVDWPNHHEMNREKLKNINEVPATYSLSVDDGQAHAGHQNQTVTWPAMRSP